MLVYLVPSVSRVHLGACPSMSLTFPLCLSDPHTEHLDTRYVNTCGFSVVSCAGFEPATLGLRVPRSAN